MFSWNYVAQLGTANLDCEAQVSAKMLFLTIIEILSGGAVRLADLSNPDPPSRSYTLH